MEESLWDTPAKETSGVKKGHSASHSKPTQEEQDAQEENLRQELANVRKVNEAIEGVIENLNKAKSNMKVTSVGINSNTNTDTIQTVNHTVGAASSLLNTWTRILSQTEHNQRLILDPAWQGASQDISDMEAETIARQQAAQRREAEEQERRNQAAKKAEEEERRRATEVNKQQKTALRVRGRVTSRGASTNQSVAGTDSSNTTMTSIGRGSNTARRTTSGLGRGRGRGRG